VDVGRGEGGPTGVVEPFLVESAFDSALAIGQLLGYLGVHSKSLSAGGDGCSLQHQTPQKHQGFRVFQFLASQERDAFAWTRTDYAWCVGFTEWLVAPWSGPIIA